MYLTLVARLRRGKGPSAGRRENEDAPLVTVRELRNRLRAGEQRRGLLVASPLHYWCRH